MGLSGSVVASTQWRGANFKRKAAASCVGVATNGTQKWCVTCGRGWSEMVTCARLFCVALPFGICVAEHPRMDLWICGAQNRRRYRRRRRCISSRSTCRTQLPSTRLSCMGMLTAHSHSRPYPSIDAWRANQKDPSEPRPGHRVCHPVALSEAWETRSQRGNN